MEASSLAFAEYRLAVRNINYDTTSKVMWGEYETTNYLESNGSETSYISMDFGHSKDKRNDKKQMIWFMALITTFFTFTLTISNIINCNLKNS